ncbi:MAG: hypothetical protein LBC48_06130 [Dysgonamonadaceae bacterium]|jgi:hypothetical protein|nr:hypothetical protein [Dysgonamonadaceae bacterium]
MKKKQTSKISRHGFIQTIANCTGLRQQTVSEWMTRDRSVNHKLAVDIAADLECVMSKAMEKWMKNPRLIAAVEKTGKRHLYKGQRNKIIPLCVDPHHTSNRSSAEPQQNSITHNGLSVIEEGCMCDVDFLQKSTIK